MVDKLLFKFRKLSGILTSWPFLKVLVKYRVAASVEHMGPLSQLERPSSIVDVGANRGQFLLAALKSFPNTRVFAFEPLSAAYRRCVEVVEDNTNVKIFNTALGAEVSSNLIQVSARDDSSSLLQIGEQQFNTFPGTEAVRREQITVDTLTNCLSPSDVGSSGLLKIDVQGYELECLLGARARLNCFKYVYVELSFLNLYEGQPLADTVIAWLEEVGFRLVGVYNMTYVNELCIQGDFLFSRRCNDEPHI